MYKVGLYGFGSNCKLYSKWDELNGQKEIRNLWEPHGKWEWVKTKAERGWTKIQVRQPSDCHDFLPTAWGATPYHWLLQVKAFLSREVKMEEMKDRVKMILILTCNFFCIWISVRGRRSELPRPNRIILKLIHSGKKDFQNLCSDNEKCISGGLCWPQPWPSGPSLASFLASPSLA